MGCSHGKAARGKADGPVIIDGVLYAFSSDWATDVLYDAPIGSVRWRWTYGGRGGGKSVEIARALVILGAIDPMIILCAREFQNSISDSVLALLEAEIYATGLNHFYTVKITRSPGATAPASRSKGCAPTCNP